MSLVSATLRARPPRLVGTTPAMHLLGNGRYSVWLTEAGMGRSSWNGEALSRWAGDRIEDADGWRVWLRDLELRRAWPLLPPPAPRPPRRGAPLAGPGGVSWGPPDPRIEAG